MNRQAIIRRLLYLRNWEFVNIFFLPASLYFALSQLTVQNWQPYAYGIFVVCVILAQGAFYWHLKLQSVYKNERELPPYFQRAYSLFQWANVILLCLYPIFAIASHTTARISFRVSFWSNALFLFAILEYGNYYHYQLSYDNLNDIRYLMKHKKIRRPPLYTDLHRKQR